MSVCAWLRASLCFGAMWTITAVARADNPAPPAARNRAPAAAPAAQTSEAARRMFDGAARCTPAGPTIWPSMSGKSFSRPIPTTPWPRRLNSTLAFAI